MEKLVTRYGLPGLPVTVVLYVMALLMGQCNKENATHHIFLSLITAALLGNAIQQIWMLVFESRFCGMGYNSLQRKALAELKKKHPSLNADQRYAKWETFLYSKDISPAIRDKDRGTWNAYHTNCTNALGLLLGAIVAITASFWFPIPKKLSMFTFAIVFFVFAVLLRKKAHQTKQLIENLEEYWASNLMTE